MRVLVATILLFLAPALWGQQTNVESVEVDWMNGLLRTTLSRPLDGSDSADALSRARRAIQRDMPDLMVGVIGSIMLDSAGTIADRLLQDPGRVAGLARVAAQAEPVRSSPSRDLRSAHIQFELHLYRDIAPVFVDHETPLPLDGRIGWQPDRGYSGIMIIADFPLDRFAEEMSADLEPTLFPGFYFATGTPSLLFRIAEASHFPAETLTQSGPALYSSDYASPEVVARVGPRPLRILARGVFGDSPTDIIVSEADARLILGSDTLKDHFSNGRITIIVSEAQLSG